MSRLSTLFWRPSAQAIVIFWATSLASLNSSTMPLISDHKLKYVLNSHGASQSIALGRRTVTHVILGMTYGGSLAGSKIQKEIARTRRSTVKYVTIEW